ncbi:DUF5064 family protein [Aquipseudomonas campi]
MFTPGHLHRASLPGQPEFTVDLYYEVRHDAQEGAMLHMRLQGVVQGQAFEDTVELHRDTAFNFASVATRLAAKHGLQIPNGLIMHSHAEFDLMFEDIRQLLDAHPGDSVDLDHLEKDRL